jgi:hypothetical protein
MLILAVAVVTALALAVTAAATALAAAAAAVVVLFAVAVTRIAVMLRNHVISSTHSLGDAVTSTDSDNNDNISDSSKHNNSV